jgi:hypothetical protein
VLVLADLEFQVLGVVGRAVDLQLPFEGRGGLPVAVAIANGWKVVSYVLEVNG